MTSKMKLSSKSHVWSINFLHVTPWWKELLTNVDHAGKLKLIMKFAIKQNIGIEIYDVRKCFDKMLSAETSNDILLNAYTDAAEQAEAAYKLSRERYDSGLVDLIAVMDSQQRWFLARSQVLTAKKNKIDTRLNLLLAFGGNF